MPDDQSQLEQALADAQEKIVILRDRLARCIFQAADSFIYLSLLVPRRQWRKVDVIARQLSERLDAYEEELTQ